jgi:predicted TIM-barrel fold metal-dependent hydrolase
MTATRERLVSADSHVRLTHDAVKERLPSRLHDDYDAAVEEVGGGIATRVGMNTLPKSFEGVRHAMGRPGNGDGIERLKDMDQDGVDVEVTYCEFSAFRYLYLIKSGWREATQAFNDCLADFAATDPDRLVASYQIPIHDIDIAVDEVHRIAARGGKSLQLPVYPLELGAPDYYDRSYDPLWAAIQEVGLPACFHIGLAPFDYYEGEIPQFGQGTIQPMSAMFTSMQYGNFILSGIFERFPDLKTVWVEPGVGWIPWWLFHLDEMATRRNYPFDEISEPPSHYYHRNMFITFIHEPFAVHQLRYEIGIENMMWSTDYPHPACTWPDSRMLVEEDFKGIPDDERQLIVCGNAERVWDIGSPS